FRLVTCFAELIAPRCARAFTRAQIGNDHSPCFFVGLDLRAFARRVAHALRAAAAQSTFFFAGLAMLFTPFGSVTFSMRRIYGNAVSCASERVEIFKNKYCRFFLDWHGSRYGIAVSILSDFRQGNALSFREQRAAECAAEKSSPPH